MDARGLVAIIVTVHEVALALGGLAASFVGLVSLLLFRNQPLARRTTLAMGFALGCGLLTYAVAARLASVRPVDVEIVRVGPGS